MNMVPVFTVCIPIKARISKLILKVDMFFSLLKKSVQQNLPKIKDLYIYKFICKSVSNKEAMPIEGETCD